MENNKTNERKIDQPMMIVYFSPKHLFYTIRVKTEFLKPYLFKFLTICQNIN